MASRKEQKEASQQRRLAQERARTERARRDRRLRMLGGVVLGAVALVAVAIAISSGGSARVPPPTPSSLAAKQAATTVSSLLAGISQDGTRLGSATAKVTVTEWGDLECPVCKDFALGAENQLISNDVRSGRVALIFRSLPTATANGPEPGVFPAQQAAALAAGNQKLGWNYILLFYHEQGSESTAYVTDRYLGGLAKQIPGLSFSRWSSDRQAAALTAQVTSDQTAGVAAGVRGTPTIVVKGPRSQTQPVDGNVSYGSLESLIKSVS